MTLYFEVEPSKDKRPGTEQKRSLDLEMEVGPPTGLADVGPLAVLLKVGFRLSTEANNAHV